MLLVAFLLKLAHKQVINKSAFVLVNEIVFNRSNGLMDLMN